MKVLWYLNLADGKYPWIENGLYPVDFDRYRRLAETIDRGGFYGALVATWPNDPFLSASFAASYTKRMRFLVAVYARMTPAKLLAQQALTFDAFTGGRLLLNLINGRDNIMATYGGGDPRTTIVTRWARLIGANFIASTPPEIRATSPTRRS